MQQLGARRRGAGADGTLRLAQYRSGPDRQGAHQEAVVVALAAGMGEAHQVKLHTVQESCTLGEPFRQGEKEIAAGTLLCFDETGAPKEPCTLMTP